MTLRLYSATVIHHDADGRVHEQRFPIRATEHEEACEMAFAYVLEVLKLKEFELRIVGG
ncbi:MAG TPA: hypothetical protein VNJ70_14265 [Thermoanaerobaculia bacterium]|nr:hypothetical protein [Thermoanaerobaculia bacterium]